MKTILLSFKPCWFEQIMSGNKIFEFRWQFPEEEVNAFVYVSRPVQQIVGYMRFGNKTNLLSLQETFKDEKEVWKALEYQIQHNRFVMNIIGYQDTERIDLDELRKFNPKFVIPQSYYYLDNFIDLFDFIREKAKMKGEMTLNSFDNISPITYGTGLINN